MAVIRLAQAAPVTSYPTSPMPIVSLFRSATRSWRSLSAVLLASAAAAFAQSPSAADGFDPNVNGNVYAVALQPDGKLILAGQFSTVSPNGSPGDIRNNLARLNVDGSLDAWNPNVTGTVRAVVLQPDGKILIGGDFTTVQPNVATPSPTSPTRNRLARFNADGSLDATFDPNLGGSLGPQVYAILLQSSGKIVVGGTFTTVQPNGAATATTRNRLARFNADGTLDTAYDPNANGIVFALAQHIDGKIIVVGGFTSLAPNGTTNPTTRNHIARLNPDGTPDSEFDPNLDNRATALAIQRDGKILVGGDFSTVKPAGNDVANTHNRLLRLNLDGQLDAGFTGNASGNVAAIAVQPDGSILTGGSFTTVWSAGSSIANRSFIARYKPDGSVDLTFGSGVNAIVDAFAFQPDGKLIIAGYFTGLQPTGATSSTVRNRVARLNPNGSLDATFNLDATGRPLVEAVQADGKIIIGGSFTSVGGVTHNHLARLNPDGSVDTTFSPDFNGLVVTLAVQPADQKILVGGTFTTIGGESRTYLARLNPSGTIDSEFNPAASGQVADIALQSDGKILVAGSFTTFQPIGAATAVNRPYLARLNSNGTIDTAFHPNPNSTVNSIAVQSDGKILLGGVFTSLTPGVDLTPVVTTNKDGTTSTTYPTGTATARNALARINADGTLDTAYDPTPNSTISALVLQADGKLVIAGMFTGLRPNAATTTTVRNRLARINTDGTVDTAYDPNANNIVLAIALQADGKLLVGGPFTTFTPNLAPNATGPYTLRKYAARLNTDGTVDATFNLDLNEINGNRVDSWFVLPDGKILVGGAFSSLQPIGAPARLNLAHFVRLTAAGTLDSSFAPGIGGTTAGQISTLVVQPDGKLIAAGSFTEIGGTTTTNIARFNPEGTPDTTFTTNLSADGPINTVLVRPGITTVTPQNKGFAWLKADGTLNPAFAPDINSRISGTINSTAIQNDGSVIVGGAFTTATGIPGPNLVRFAPNGAIDPNFGPGPNGEVDVIVVQSDGRILVGGTFTTIAGANRSFIARLNTDGTIDNGFNPFASARVNSIVIQADGNMVIGGQFTSLNPNATTTTTVTTTTATPNAGNSTNSTTAANGAVTTTTVSTVSGTTTTTVTVVSATPTTRNYIARIKPDGTLDTAYNPSANGNVNALVLQADGKVVAGGAFTTLQPGATGTAVTRNRLARINTDGTIDTGYDPNASDVVNALALYVDGKVIVGGAFTVLNPNTGPTPFTRNHIARLNTDGTLDSNFDPNANSTVLTVAVQADAKIVFGGQFSTVQPNGAVAATTRNAVARVDFAGGLDTAFDPNANAVVNVVLPYSDGTVLVGGSFSSLQPNPPLIVAGSFNTIGGVASRNLALLGDDGSVSSIFQPNPNGAVTALLVQADGKLIVGGAFTNVGGATRNRLARFNADYTLDSTYKPSLDSNVASIALQADGKILAATGTQLVRLNTDGTVDGSFTVALTGSLRNFRAIALQADGKVLALAQTGTTSSPVDVLQRWNADGSVDGTFAAVTSTGGTLQTLALMADRRLFLGGSFASLGTSSIPRLVRVNTNGAIDSSFNPTPNGPVTALAVQTDGRLVLAGNFTAVGGLPRGGLARLAATLTATQAVTATSSSTVWVRGGASPELANVTFEQSSDALNWTTLGAGGRVSGTANWQLNGLSLPTSGLFYLRARGVTPSGNGTSSGIIETAREFNLTAIAGVGPASNTVATLDIGGVLIDAATGLIVGQSAPASTPALATLPIGVVAQPMIAPNGFNAGTVRLTNFSARARVSPGGVLLMGFAINGSAPRTVLLRAAGPSLTAFGVNGVLAGPRLQLLDSAGTVVGGNSGWGSTPANLAAVTAADTRTGAFPFSASTSADAAMVVTLPPGTYSMLVFDNAGTGGITLAEIYDAGDSTNASQIVNLSIRGNVNPGEGAFLSGFVLTGNAAQSVLVRGDGPSLTQFGVPGALADPVVSVFNGTGQLLDVNDNWSQTTGGVLSASSLVLQAAARSAGAYPLVVGSADSALALTLVPGTYTVQVTSATTATGAALIEIYQLP